MQQSPPQQPREPVSNPGSGVTGDESWLEMRSVRSCAQVLRLKSLTAHEGATSAGSGGTFGRGRGPTSAFVEVLLQTAVLLLHINSGFCGDVSLACTTSKHPGHCLWPPPETLQQGVWAHHHPLPTRRDTYPGSRRAEGPAPSRGAGVAQVAASSSPDSPQSSHAVGGRAT